MRRRNLKNQEKTYYIKPCWPVYDSEPKLDPVLVSINKQNGIQTSLCLDTNILIAMEKTVFRGNNWRAARDQGLHNLIKLLQRCTPASICIAPGIALEEMPPALAEQARVYYELFCSALLPGFIDTPNCIHKEFSGKINDYGFMDLDYKAQAFLSIPFTSIINLIICDKKMSGPPIEKFKRFLSRIIENLDVLGAKEIEIAKYCFSEPPADCRRVIDIRKALRKNFLKTKDKKLPKTAKEVLKIAFNGACDLHLINAANTIDASGIEGIKQDCWIATQDKKLVEFASIFNYINIDGEAGKYAAASILPEHHKDNFWLSAELEHKRLLWSRKERNASIDVNLSKLVNSAMEAIKEVELLFE